MRVTSFSFKLLTQDKVSFKDDIVLIEFLNKQIEHYISAMGAVVCPLCTNTVYTNINTMCTKHSSGEGPDETHLSIGSRCVLTPMERGRSCYRESRLRFFVTRVEGLCS